MRGCGGGVYQGCGCDMDVRIVRRREREEEKKRKRIKEKRDNSSTCGSKVSLRRTQEQE